MQARKKAIVVLTAILLAPTAAPAAERHDISVTLDPRARTLAGRDVVAVEAGGQLAFTLAPGLTVEELRLDGRALPVDHEDGRWSAAVPGQGLREVEIAWRGILPPLDPESGPFGGLGLGPRGGFLPAGSGWMPETGAEAVTFRLRVEVPNGQIAVATGDLVEEERGVAYRAVFEAKHPGEPPSLFTGPYAITERTEANLRLRAYLHDEAAPLAEGLLTAAAGHLERFRSVIGAYPYGGFAIVSAPLPVGLGFPGLTYVGTRVLPLPFFAGRSLAHEVLHDWWGNAVRVDYRGGNWAEALTTYMADHALAAEDSPAQAERMRLDWLRDFAALPRQRDVPLRAFTSKTHDAAQVVGYGKGAFLFHMLKGEIGPTAFREGIRDFWQANRHGRAGWPELRAAFERASGRDLDWFFAQWLDRPGAPRLSLDTASIDGNQITVHLRQEGRPWRLRVPVVVETAQGAVHHVIRLEGETATARIQTPATPLAVTVDPGHDLFRRLHPEETPPIVRDVTLDPATRPVILTDAEGTARTLARRMLDDAAAPLPPESAAVARAPLLLIGETARVEDFLRRAGLPPPPPSLQGEGTARVWTADAGDGRKILAVAAEDTAALDSLLRPLPHYRRDSYLVFDAGRVIERGLWPAGQSPMRIVFGGE